MCYVYVHVCCACEAAYIVIVGRARGAARAGEARVAVARACRRTRAVTIARAGGHAVGAARVVPIVCCARAARVAGEPRVASAGAAGRLTRAVAAACGASGAVCSVHAKYVRACFCVSVYECACAEWCACE